MTEQIYYKLEFYVPETHCGEVKDAVFEAGGGRLGNYDCCCWQTIGSGQFRPGDGSSPFIGESGTIEQVREVKVELIMSAGVKNAVITALKQAHPYETPAYQYWQVKI